MRKLLFCILAFPFLSTACSDSDKEDVIPSLKKVSVELQRTSEQLALLEDDNLFTVSLDTKFNSADWSAHMDNNDGTRILIQVNKNLTPTSTFEFEQSKVDFQIVNATYVMAENVDEEDISYSAKIIIRVDNKIVKEETISSFRDSFPHIFQYTE